MRQQEWSWGFGDRRLGVSEMEQEMWMQAPSEERGEMESQQVGVE